MGVACRFSGRSFLACLVLVDLAACGAPANDPNLTPSENQLRQRAAQFNNTLAEGAGVGAVAGAITGALLAHNRAEGAAIGAAAGAALGGGVGYMVASRNQAQSQTEDQYQKSIAQANATAQQSESDAAAAEQEAGDIQEKLRQLDTQIASRQISASDYQTQLQELRGRDRDLATIAAHYEAQTKGMSIYASGRPDPAPMMNAAETTQQSLERIQKSEAMVSSALGSMPTAPGTPAAAGT